MVQHQAQAFFRHVSGRFAINLVTELHVVGGNAFRYRSSGGPSLEELASDFLPCADFCESAILRLIEVNGQSLSVRR